MSSSRMSTLALYGKAVRKSLPGRKTSSVHVPSRTVTDVHRIMPSEVAKFDHVVAADVSNVVPPSFLHVLGFPLTMRLMTDPGFPLPPIGMVHIHNSFVQHVPVLIGQDVEVSAHVGTPREHAKGTEVDLFVTGRVAGDVVFEETSTYLAKGKRLPGAAPALTRSSERFEMTQTDGTWRFTQAEARDYAKVSGDYNPIHRNVLAAKAFGFPRTIAHGMYTAARAFSAARITDEAFRWDVKFGKPVVLPSTVGFNVSRTHVDEVEGHVGIDVFDPGAGTPFLQSTVTPKD